MSRPELSAELLALLARDEAVRAQANVRAHSRRQGTAAPVAPADLASLEEEHGAALNWYAALTEASRLIVRALLEPALPPNLRIEARRDASYDLELRYRRELVLHVGRVHALVGALQAQAKREPRTVEEWVEMLTAEGLRAGSLWALVENGRIRAVRRLRPRWGWHRVEVTTGSVENASPPA